MAPFYSQKLPQFSFKSAPSCRRLFLRLPKRVVFPLFLAVQITTNFPPKGSQSKVNLFSFPFLPPGRGRVVRPPPSKPPNLTAKLCPTPTLAKKFQWLSPKSEILCFSWFHPVVFGRKRGLDFHAPCGALDLRPLSIPLVVFLRPPGTFLTPSCPNYPNYSDFLPIPIIPSFRFAIPSFAPRCVATRLNWFLVWFIILRV